MGKAGNIYSSGYELDGSSYVISKNISNTWLWDRVRVSGGAYGGFCDFDSHSGKLLFFSVLILIGESLCHVTSSPSDLTFGFSLLQEYFRSYLTVTPTY